MSVYLPAIESLEAQKSAIQQQAESDIAALDEIIEKLRKLNGTPRAPLFESVGVSVPPPRNMEDLSKRKSAPDLEAKVQDWLRRHGRAATVQEIYHGLLREGYQFGYQKGVEARSLGIYLRHRRENLHYDRERNTYAS